MMKKRLIDFIMPFMKLVFQQQVQHQEYATILLGILEKKDKERIIEETFRNGRLLGNNFEEEIRKCIENVIEIEIDYINECQKKSLKGETYCDNCSPCCLEKRIARKG